MILLILYVVLGYWATGKTIFHNKIVIHEAGGLALQRLGWGVVLGWILIPVALLLKLFGKR